MARTFIQKHFIGLIIIFLGSVACKERSNVFEPKIGDLLFQDIDCGPVCEAIEKVTKGVNNADLSHVGIVDTLNEQIVILEAISQGVVYTPLAEFLSRSADTSGNPKVLVGRLQERYKPDIPAMMEQARMKLGLAYDQVFTMNDSLYYCSELVFDAYMVDSVHLFSLAPMTFKEITSNEFFPSWVAYYKNLNHPLPEGELGINPGLISRSKKIEIVHVYGYPEGYVPDHESTLK